MMNLFIGLCLGIAAAVTLGVMWRMVARLRYEQTFLNSEADDEMDERVGRLLQDRHGDR